MNRKKSTIVLHDYFEVAEGGGRVCISLVNGLGTHLAYGFKAENHPYFNTIAEGSQEYDLKAYSRWRGYKQLKLIRVFSRKATFTCDYKTVVYSGFYSVCAIFCRGYGRNIHYCHTPPRYMYDKRTYYRKQAGLLGRSILDWFNRYYQPRYEEALNRMDLLLTNSKNVQKRIKDHLGLDAAVVYPPCDTKYFEYLGQESYYLSMGRLEPLKRIKRIVRAFVGMPEKRLIVVSGGSDYEEIQRMASPTKNIQVLGWVDESTLLELLGNCIATIYIPESEDFGMSPVESMAAGKPVIGVREGGLAETVIDGETGVLLSADPNTEQIQSSIRWLTPRRAIKMQADCQRRAEQFSLQMFLHRMNEIICN